MTTLRALAPAKVNLCLFLGAPRADGLHELVSLVEAVSLADELSLTSDARGDADEVACPGIEGPNLAAQALAAYRARSGWDGPPQRLEIAKRIPVAGGMGGGSSDAAAALRLAAAAAGRAGDELIAELAPRLGADVPALIDPGLKLVGGAGEEVAGRPALAPHALVVLPSAERLATAAVYAEADRLGLGREAGELAARRDELAALPARAEPPADLLVNDLAPAAIALCPAIEGALAAVAGSGADRALVSGSGPTVFGIFWGADCEQRAAAAAGALARDHPGTVAAAPVEGSFAAVTGG